MLFEKYRPLKFDDIVGNEKIIEQLKKLIKSKDGIPHCFFYGPAGTGKTTISRVVGRELFGNYFDIMFHEFNASDERGIDVVREKVKQIAMQAPTFGQYNLVLMDEADYITGDAQACFRGILEKYHKTCRFIFTANYPYKLIAPIKSRFLAFEMSPLDLKTVALHLKKIGVKEGLKEDDKFYIGIASKASGDFRRAINLLEGNFEVDKKSELDAMTLKEIASLESSKRFKLAFDNEPENVMGKLWEKVQKEERHDLLTDLCDCEHKMNISIHKTMFLANFLIKLGK